MSLKNVSNEEKLKIAKDIVVAYITSSVEKKGDESSKQSLKADDVCNLIKKVFSTIDEILPVTESKVGIH